MAEIQGDQAREGREEEAQEGRGEDVAPPAGDADIVVDTVAAIARALVEHPDEVRVESVSSDLGPRYRLSVHPDDVGRVIGKGGHVARSIRQLSRAAAARAGIRIVLEIGE